MILSDVVGLGKWSKKEIEVKCDVCQFEKKLTYHLYTSYGYENGNYLCKKCKLKKNNLEKWGVENVFQLESVKTKSKKTNLEKFGVEYVSQSKELKEKIKISKSQLDYYLINEKRKSTNLEKWGVENVSQSKYVKSSKELKYESNWKSTNNKKSEEFRKANFKVAQNPNYIKYIENGTSIFNCDNGNEHQFEINIDCYSKRVKYKTILCTICNPIDKHQSGKEIKLYNFIKSIYNGEIIQNYRLQNQELDVFLPQIKTGFELNGIHWHSDIYKDRNFHLNKSKFFDSNNINLFHIWEDDWDSKTQIIQSQIKNVIGLSRKIPARKCQVKSITDSKLVRKFLDDNHIQGFSNSNVKIGLYYQDDLVSIMTFDKFEGRNKMSDLEWSLNRFCNKLDISVIGGASKLLSFFIKSYNPKRVISYADKDWSKGNLYQKLDFIKVHETEPDYKYVIKGKRIHKSNLKKSVTGVSESKLTIPKIWDCGKIKWEKTF
jgi:hypothetical protein